MKWLISTHSFNRSKRSIRAWWFMKTGWTIAWWIFRLTLVNQQQSKPTPQIYKSTHRLSLISRVTNQGFSIIQSLTKANLCKRIRNQIILWFLTNQCLINRCKIKNRARQAKSLKIYPINIIKLIHLFNRNRISQNRFIKTKAARRKGK